jgi:hypothetical protein
MASEALYFDLAKALASRATAMVYMRTLRTEVKGQKVLGAQLSRKSAAPYRSFSLHGGPHVLALSKAVQSRDTYSRPAANA